MIKEELKAICILKNDECLCDDEQKKLCSNHKILPKNELKQKAEQKIMHDTIKEFIDTKNLKNSRLELVTKDGKMVYTSVEDFVKQYHIFLKKSSYLKF